MSLTGLLIMIDVATVHFTWTFDLQTQDRFRDIDDGCLTTNYGRQYAHMYYDTPHVTCETFEM